MPDSVSRGPMVTPIFFVIIAIAVALALIPATIARKKGYGFVGFFVLGIFFFLIALIVALCLDDKTKRTASIVIAPDSFSTNGNISTADEIQKFKKLLDSGVISQEEFEAKKRELLNHKG